ncbi:male accessory gland serine protease inhibitor-like [Drosophila subobscura]|uniref:male accessory gland serine protease inhibitor-like n=1 Tax=Drosophila subobscura TaxID=7241 RepID=UPI00155B25BD|nr:male accessory gland serine protease inhibitor-like [Drosophila subobscura]
MKLLSIIGIILALSGVSLALRDFVCGQVPEKQGDGNKICLAYMERFSYYRDRNECVRWVYGGCGRNLNNFGSKDLCEAICKEQPKYQPTKYE